MDDVEPMPLVALSVMQLRNRTVWTALPLLRRHRQQSQSRFFQNEVILVQLDELDESDRITHAWIGFNYGFRQAQKTF